MGYHWTTGAGPSGLIIAPAPGVCAWATPFFPVLAKRGGSRWDFVPIFFSSSSIQTVYMVSVQASIFLVLLQVGMTGDPYFLVVQDSFHELTLQPHHSATA